VRNLFKRLENVSQSEWNKTGGIQAAAKKGSNVIANIAQLGNRFAPGDNKTDDIELEVKDTKKDLMWDEDDEHEMRITREEADTTSIDIELNEFSGAGIEIETPLEEKESPPNSAWLQVPGKQLDSEKDVEEKWLNVPDKQLDDPEDTQLGDSIDKQKHFEFLADKQLEDPKDKQLEDPEDKQLDDPEDKQNSFEFLADMQLKDPEDKQLEEPEDKRKNFEFL